MKTISVIIATYNASETIERCLDSIVHQKNSDVELLVIDGNSKDSTLDILNKYKDYIDVLISEPDNGIYDAWNKGVALASGKWIMFLGADDIYADDTLIYYLDFLSKGNYDDYDLITGKSEIVDSNGKVLRIYGNPYRWDEFRRFMKISHGSSLHNCNLFKELGPFDLNVKICADYDFLLRKKMKSIHVDKIMLKMQFGGMSTKPQALLDAFRIRQAHRSIPLYLNCYYFIKGMCGLYLRNLYWKIIS